VATANVDALRAGYEALNRGDLSAVLALLDPEIEWHEPAPSPDESVADVDEALGR
jgi:ketosteroid isomerase-like protein